MRLKYRILGIMRAILGDGMLDADTRRRLRWFLNKNDRILDIGALSSPFAKGRRNFTVAIDMPSTGRFGFIAERVVKLRKWGNIQPVFGNGVALPIRDECFDFVLLTEVIEHVWEDRELISEAHRVLRPGGKVFVTTPNAVRTPLEKGIAEHVRHYTPNELLQLFADFEIIYFHERFHGDIWWYVEKMRRYSYGENGKPRILYAPVFFAAIFLQLTLIYAFVPLQEHFLHSNTLGDNLVLVAQKR